MRPTAEGGRWVKGPGADFFENLRQALGGLPLIAEDLGLITPEVEALRDQFNLPGMRILQFAFGEAAENRFLPHNYDRNTVVYTGTHDNDTTARLVRRPWRAGTAPFLRRYLGRDGRRRRLGPDPAGLGFGGRLCPGAAAGRARPGDRGAHEFSRAASRQLGLRFTQNMLRPEALDRLTDFTELYGR